MKLKASGIQDGTLRQIDNRLRNLAKRAYLHKPEEVKTAIANYKSNRTKKPVQNSFKNNLIKAYNYFASINGIQWIRPHYRYERKVPLIPTTKAIDKIISASSKKYATIFTILAETGAEGKELEIVNRRDIDSEQGIINFQGCKAHNSRAIKLGPKTADMLRQYLHKYTGNQPFPRSDAISRIWQRTRDKLADKVNEPQLKTVQLRLLRHYQATKFYDRTKDIIATKNRLGHKKIETTMLYTQLIVFSEEEEYTVRTVLTLKEAVELIEHGFTYITEMNGAKLFRKRK